MASCIKYWILNRSEFLMAQFRNFEPQTCWSRISARPAVAIQHKRWGGNLRTSLSGIFGHLWTPTAGEILVTCDHFMLCIFLSLHIGVGVILSTLWRFNRQGCIKLLTSVLTQYPAVWGQFGKAPLGRSSLRNLNALILYNRRPWTWDLVVYDYNLNHKHMTNGEI